MSETPGQQTGFPIRAVVLDEDGDPIAPFDLDVDVLVDDFVPPARISAVRHD
jgi:hypothetical protein